MTIASETYLSNLKKLQDLIATLPKSDDVRIAVVTKEKA